MTKQRKGPKRTGKKVRVDMRKNRAKAVRDKSEWTRVFRDGDIKHEDAETSESVRAKGELSRKRTVIVHEKHPADDRLITGVVVTMRGLIAEVDDGEQRWACTVRRMLRTRLIGERHPTTVGDRVRFLPIEVSGETSRAVSDAQKLPEGVIEEVAERKTALVRQYMQRVQVVAANVDLALIVVAADQPPLRPHLIDRYLVAVHEGGLRPVVCINKLDLDAGGLAASVAGRYVDLGYRALCTCATDGRGLEELRDLLTGQTSVLIGPSGVGKSTLLNALDPGLSLKVGSLTDLRRGRHTTTTARLLRWSFAGYVVDTPGMRQFDPARIEPQALEAYFVEFVDLVKACRFPDCSHTHEDDCAVKAAVEAGQITSERYNSYCKMYEECLSKQKS